MEPGLFNCGAQPRSAHMTVLNGVTKEATVLVATAAVPLLSARHFGVAMAAS